MKLPLLVLAAVALVGAAPLAAAEPWPFDGFGHCEIVWYSYGVYEDPLTGEEESLEAPGGYECVW